jgi:2-hydroxy-3-keto-5-methylthiopentenyl-1-phosphate phosphatase
MRCHVFVDFDGTIAALDTTDLLLEQFADPKWHDVEEDWRAGRIGSRECLVRQIDLVRATPRQMEAFVANIEIDPDFPEFADLCRSRGLATTVVSDGLDFTVGRVLAQHGLEIPYFANHLEWVGKDRWRLTFPHARSNCRPLSGNCKCQFSDAEVGKVRIVVGDGRSDFCVAEGADLVLAKSALERHCRERNLVHYAFDGFGDATRLLAAWLDERAAVGVDTEALRDK